jgi:hypothetical protein
MIIWRKSTHSGGAGGTGECVELAALEAVVGIRDSKIPEEGHLEVTPSTFVTLVHRIKAGELDQ